MIFTDATHNIQIELLGISSCKLTIINGDLKQLDGTNRLLNAYVREAPLDSRTPAQFEHTLNPSERYIAITGNLINAIHALYALDCLSDSLQGDIMEQVLLDTFSQALNGIPVEKQPIVVSRMQTIMDALHYTSTLSIDGSR